MSEIWELYTKQKEKTGLFYDTGTMLPLPKDLLHLMVEIWVKNENGELLIKQRHPTKECGFMWENARGNVLAGEEALDSAVRVLSEETGIVSETEELIYLGETEFDNHIMYSFLYEQKEAGSILHLKPNDTIEARYISADILDDLEEEIVPNVWKRYIKYRDRLKDN